MQFTLRGAIHLPYSFRAALLGGLPGAAVPRLNMQLLHASRSMTSSDAIKPSRLDSTSGRHKYFPCVFIRVYMLNMYFGCWV